MNIVAKLERIAAHLERTASITLKRSHRLLKLTSHQMVLFQIYAELEGPDDKNLPRVRGAVEAGALRVFKEAERLGIHDTPGRLEVEVVLKADKRTYAAVCEATLDLKGLDGKDVDDDTKAAMLMVLHRMGSKKDDHLSMGVVW